MRSMLDMIKQNAVPAAVMRSAAKGILSVPPPEMIQILVYLTANPLFGSQARLTLAEWDTASAVSAVSDHSSPQEVLDYFWADENRQPRLMPALIENPRISEAQLVELASKASREIAAMMIASPRVQGSKLVLAALSENPHLAPAEMEQVQSDLDPALSGPPKAELSQDEPISTEPVDPEAETAHQAWHESHAAEIAAEEGKAFELVDTEAASTQPSPTVAQTEPASTSNMPVPAWIAAGTKTLEPERLSTLQKLARMNVAGRIKVAFLGSKEERSILIRDGAKIVQNAVLASPKLSELEVETFAALKNVQENVLREIARGRRFMKNYIVVKNLVNNPKCPLDVSLTLIKNLLVMDLKVLQGNKNVPETLRKVAFKIYKEKSTPPGQRGE
ncbi:MAG TPA: hypothetical protein VHA33_19275 [Candidatus Angelobacter sp.]|nr:hypothetical protein [Candidatus Angelobacter sp.]